MNHDCEGPRPSRPAGDLAAGRASAFSARGPDQPVLSPNVVHVWLARLDASSPGVAEFEGLLAPDERERARRFHRRVDRTRFIVRRGVLRRLISAYLGRRPAGVEFDYDVYGKPRIKRGADELNLGFSVAKSMGVALFAFALGPAVGVDVEWLRDIPEAETIARTQFAPEEARALEALPPGLRQRAFLECWTCKEAYVKARGVGLSLALDRFAVTCTPGAGPALIRTEEGAPPAARWEMVALRPVEPWVGALVVPRPIGGIASWRVA